MKTAVAFLVSILFFSCNNASASTEAETGTDSITESKAPAIDANIADADSSVAPTNFSVQTFKNAPGEGPEGYGFDIYQNGKVLIHQNAIPAIQGNKAFVSEEEAKALGSLMLYKISNGIMPPTISIEDLDSMGVKY